MVTFKQQNLKLGMHRYEILADNDNPLYLKADNRYVGR